MTKRMVMIDDNIQDASGHYLELSHMLAKAAANSGLPVILATHKNFEPDDETLQLCQVYPIFKTTKMIRWSLGANGKSSYPRDIKGNISGAPSVAKLSQIIFESFRHPSRKAKNMLIEWSNSFREFLDTAKITEEDLLILNTADDFTLLAMAAALSNHKNQSFNCHLIFHFSTNDKQTKSGRVKNDPMRSQIEVALRCLKNHRVTIHTTTEELKHEINAVMNRDIANAIPYPTRICRISEGVNNTPCKATFAGMPRAEKGKHSIHQFLENLEHHQLIGDSKYQPSLQLPRKHWRSVVPKTMHHYCADNKIEVITSHLSTEAYQKWLDQTGIGIFLYDPIRYQSRCSGVLLEMLCRGIPVIVPASCWLSSQVESAGGNGTVGYIYQNTNEIPMLLKRFLSERNQINKNSRIFSEKVMKMHVSDRTLEKMNL